MVVQIWFSGSRFAGITRPFGAESCVGERRYLLDWPPDRTEPPGKSTVSTRGGRSAHAYRRKRARTAIATLDPRLSYQRSPQITDTRPAPARPRARRDPPSPAAQAHSRPSQMVAANASTYAAYRVAVSGPLSASGVNGFSTFHVAIETARTTVAERVRPKGGVRVTARARDSEHPPSTHPPTRGATRRSVH